MILKGFVKYFPIFLIMAYGFLCYGKEIQGRAKQASSKMKKPKKHTKILKLETVTYSNAAPDAMQNKCT